VTPYYDPMLAKLIVWAETREAAIRRMRRALGEYLVLGVKTTIPFHRWLMDHPPFRAGDMDTGYLERHWPPSGESSDDVIELAALVAAISAHQGRASGRPATTTSDGAEDRWAAFARRAGLRVP
jgi:acetyl/propionyl-CoA carboxylase alpha subunit